MTGFDPILNLGQSAVGVGTKAERLVANNNFLWYQDDGSIWEKAFGSNVWVRRNFAGEELTVDASITHQAVKYTIAHLSDSAAAATEYQLKLTMLDQSNQEIIISGDSLAAAPTLITDNRLIKEAENTATAITGTMGSLEIDKLSAALWGRIRFEYKVTYSNNDFGVKTLEQHGLFATDPLPIYDCTPSNFVSQLAAMLANGGGTLNLTTPGNYDLIGLEGGKTAFKSDSAGGLNTMLVRGLGKDAGTVIRFTDNGGFNQVRPINIINSSNLEFADLEIDGYWVNHYHPDTPSRLNTTHGIKHGAVDYWKGDGLAVYDWIGKEGIDNGYDEHGATIQFDNATIMHQSNILLRDCTNVLLRNVRSVRAGGDGFNFGDVSGVFLDNTLIDDCMRNGVTFGQTGSSNIDIGIGGNCELGALNNVQNVDFEHSIINQNIWLHSGITVGEQDYDYIDQDQIWALADVDGVHLGAIDVNKTPIAIRNSTGVVCNDVTNIGALVVDGTSDTPVFNNPTFDIDGSKLRRVSEGGSIQNGVYVPFILAGILCREANGGRPVGLELNNPTIVANNIDTDVIEINSVESFKMENATLTGDNGWGTALRLRGKSSSEPLDAELSDNSANLAPTIVSDVNLI